MENIRILILLSPGSSGLRVPSTWRATLSCRLPLNWAWPDRNRWFWRRCPPTRGCCVRRGLGAGASYTPGAPYLHKRLWGHTQTEQKSHDHIFQAHFWCHISNVFTCSKLMKSHIDMFSYFNNIYFFLWSFFFK